MAGRLGDSEEIVAEALEAEPGPGASLQAVTTAAFVLLNGDGDLDTVHRLLVRAIEAQGDELDATDEDLAAAVYLLLLVCGFAGRAELWAPYFAILDRLRPGVPEDLLLASRTMPDPVRDAVPVLDRLEQVIAELDDESDSWHLRKVTLAAVFIDRLGGCRQAIRRMVKRSRETGAWTLVVSALNFMCLDYFLTGEWDELEQLLAECFEICEHAGLRLYVPVLRYDRALVAAARGDDALARELADAITDWAEPRGAHLIAQFASHARGLAALGRGDFEAAYHHASAVCPPGEFVPYARHALWVCMDLVEAAVRTDRHAEAAAHVAAMQRYGIARISPRIALLAGGSAGLAARRRRGGVGGVRAGAGDPGSRSLAVRPGSREIGLRRATASRALGARRRRTARRRPRCVSASRRDPLGPSRGRRAAGHRPGSGGGEHERLRRAAHPAGARDRQPRGRRTDQQADRRTPLPLAPHGQRPPVSDLPQAGDQHASRAARCAAVGSRERGCAMRPSPDDGAVRTTARLVGESASSACRVQSCSSVDRSTRRASLSSADSPGLIVSDREEQRVE